MLCQIKVFNVHPIAIHHSPLNIKPPEGSNHVLAEQHKDVRWFSWFDHAQEWDKVWHAEGLVHSLQWWTEGKSPWHHLPTSSTDSETYSSRVFAWNVSSLEFVRKGKDYHPNPNRKQISSRINKDFRYNSLILFARKVSDLPMSYLEMSQNASCLFPSKVLADDTNQDMMRSMVSIFRPLRIYAAEYVV